MRTKHIIFAGVLLVSICCDALADRQLERAEILQIFQQLTSQPRETWIAAGTIEATHEEYRAPQITDVNEINGRVKQKIQGYLSDSERPEQTQNLQKIRLDAIPFNARYELSNEYTMVSTEVVRFDGERFYWEIDVDSRTDSIKPGKDLTGNFMTEEFNLDWNSKRIFAWDGEKFTTYFPSVNNSMVDTIGDIPCAVRGPLTAGFIPWGRGYCEYDSLVNSESSAVEKNVNDQTQIHMVVNNTDGSQMLFVMDPKKDYAVISSSVTSVADSITSAEYSDYQLVSNNWVPTTILIERYEAGSNRLLARNLWNITSLDANVPQAGSFNVEYEDDALVEFSSDVAEKPLFYRHSEIVDTDLLLAKRLDILASEGAQVQNCATIAMEYITGQLGKDVTEQQLAGLVSGPDGTTSIYAMKQFAQGLGLYCRAVQTDIETLKQLNGCQAILHIPGKEHFVVFDGIDDNYVWTIDLADNEFYYRSNIDFFGMDWSQGTALLVSNQPIDLQGNFTDIDDTELQSIVGAEDEGYACTRLYQNEYTVFCAEPVGGICGGYYKAYRERWGCQAAASGNCKGTNKERMRKAICINDPYDPWACTVAMPWYISFMLACA